MSSPSGVANPALVDRIGRLIDGGPKDRPPLIGIAGAQGSGKTTVARAAAVRFGAAQISLDDVYRTRAEREVLACDLHPLFAVRGPPGTHDLVLLSRTLEPLAAAGPGDETPLPAFDKRADDRLPDDAWPRVSGRPSAILVDGWCLGAVAEEEAALVEPVNALESQQDADGRWRRAVNGFLAGPYADVFARFDAVLFLKAPSFDVVLDWRAEQEADLLGVAPADLPSADRDRIGGFVQHFERITRHMLAGGIRADVVATLDETRAVTSIRPA